MTTGKLKVFRSLTEWLAEFRIYRRDEKGQVVKQNDHLMDTTRYLVRSGKSHEKTMPIEVFAQKQGLPYLEPGKSRTDENPLFFGMEVN